MALNRALNNPETTGNAMKDIEAHRIFQSTFRRKEVMALITKTLRTQAIKIEYIAVYYLVTSISYMVQIHH